MDQWFLPALSEVLSLAEAECGFEAVAGGRDVVGNVSLNRNRHRSAAEAAQQRLKAEREWCGAVAALNCLLQQQFSLTVPATLKYPAVGQEESHAQDFDPSHGLILSGPMPVLTHPALVSRVASCTFTSDPLNPALWLLGERNRHSMPLLPLPEGCTAPASMPRSLVPLLSDDPLSDEQFCVVLTHKLSLVMVLGTDSNGQPAFQFSFDPEVVAQAWHSLRPRVLLAGSTAQLSQLDNCIERFAPAAPDYKTVMQFSRLLLKYMPEPVEWENSRSDAPVRLLSAAVHDSPQAAGASSKSAWRSRNVNRSHSDSDGCVNERTKRPAAVKTNLNRETLEQRLEHLAGGTGTASNERSQAYDVELLQAMAHEVRTPLATIRTLTRLLLKRRNLEPEVIKRLEMIDRECSEQIDRFGLIFRAVELETSETKRAPVHLTSTPLTQVFDSCIPRWQKQASRRNLTLDVVLPQKMPSVVSDPTMLDQVLTGVIENFTASQPAGGHVEVQVMLAGDQLKVQLQCQTGSEKLPANASTSPLKSIGQLLVFQPETGNLTLNLSVTKNLFQALGAKLIVRQKPEQGEVLTIFLPLE
ncbi:sensor histidine kinase [Microcoleus sp. FACHB-672]|uniref:sensor histidine kinase n=1 Tax=Microcoleus sp. FACHB-672 TaxID=2692825 RepID=UPI0016840680|nr:HAMP domain-containing sensor histidine kinase [Microcoleus sp. FACHB-672]MBD2043156.1 HAMP domain-containing histidine kinase [Microcoleus sp. FACHB-672]